MATFREQIAVFTGGLGPLASKTLADAAHKTQDDIIADQRSRLGVDPGVTTAVDGERNKRFEDVKPDGAIYIGFDYRAEAIQAGFEELRARSPRVTGSYADSHFAILDGAALDPLAVPSAAQLANVNTIVLTNPQLYARKLEVGKDKLGRPFVKQVSPHIYESAMLALRKVYGNIARIDFNYVDLGAGTILRRQTWQEIRSFKLGTHTSRKVARATSVERNPAIIITRI